MQLTVLALLALAAPPKFTAEQVAFYEKQVLPILKEHCFKCHTGKKVRGKLWLDTRTAILEGGDLVVLRLRCFYRPAAHGRDDTCERIRRRAVVRW